MLRDYWKRGIILLAHNQCHISLTPSSVALSCLYTILYKLRRMYGHSLNISIVPSGYTMLYARLVSLNRGSFSL
jgi:hypothetical protein